MAGIAAFGTLLKRGDGATAEAFTTIANITNITGPQLENTELNVSAHDSVGAYMEFIATGLKNPGTLDLEGNFNPSDATHEQWLDDLDAADEHNYQLVFPTDPAITWTFAGIVMKFSAGAPYEDKLTFTGSLRISGAVTRP